MPLEITPSEVRRALATLQQRDGRAADDARAAIDALTWRDSDDDPVVVARYTLQRFLWYELPHKWLAPVDELREVAAALAAFFEEVGASRYAEICRSADTDRMIATDGDGFIELMEASGLEPPDCALLEWGGLMTVDEAEVRDEASRFLEDAIDRGMLVPGASGWQERQQDLMERFLTTADMGEAPLTLIRRARIEQWVGHPTNAARRAVLGPLVPQLEGPAPDDHHAGRAIEPLLWLLERLDAGVELTQTGAFSRRFVQEAVTRYPNWWQSDLFDPPTREAEVFPLEVLHDAVLGLRLTRRRGRTLYATKRAGQVRDQPTVLLAAVMAGLAGAEEPARGGLDVTLALLLRDPPLAGDDLLRRLSELVPVPAMIADEERLIEILPDVVLGHAASVLAPFDGIAQRGKAPTLTESGRLLAIEILRARATGPGGLFW